MRAPAVSSALKISFAVIACLLACSLTPLSLAFAEGEDAPSAPLASSLMDGSASVVREDVPLAAPEGDAAPEPVIGSFTVDGLTFAVVDGMTVELVGVSPDWQQVAGVQEGDGSPVAPMLAAGPDGSDADSPALAAPESVTYNGVDYAVTSIGAYAFYLSGVMSVELPASITQVDDRAFRSSDVASVTVADGNPSYSSFDGTLYDADQLSLLLIPEGKQGTVLLPSTAESAAPSVFSHCPLVTQIAVEEGSAAFASENGLLYNSGLTTLLRVPAGATDITIHDGCTAIAAGALEACASLATITAPASVTSISPDVFTSVPTVSLPVASAVADDPGVSTAATEEPSEQAGSTPASDSASTQITAMVALSAVDSLAMQVNASSTEVFVSVGANSETWSRLGFFVKEDDALILQEGASYAAGGSISMNGGTCRRVVKAGAGTVDAFGVGDDWSSFVVSTTRISWFSGAWQMTEYADTFTPPTGYIKLIGWSTNSAATSGVTSFSITQVRANNYYAIWQPINYTIAFDAQGGDSVPSISATYRTSHELPASSRKGYAFKEWNTAIDGSGISYQANQTVSRLTATNGATVNLYAQWERVDYNLGFDVDSEPGDENRPGVEKPDETVNVESGPTVIEDPKRPGYVFQGWVIPNADGTEAIDQDLVYQDEADGKWYVDASKLPDYANDEGRVELTARWTSVISVDVPSAVTFYADVVTQGNESREGAASSAFGQNKVASQSEVDLRIVGLESTAVATEGTTLGADSILKKSSSATPSSSTQKLFSLYPTDKALTPDDLQDPDAVSATKPADAVDFALDDLLLEKSFAADAFTIPAGDTLNLGYRLNLAETGTELDYDTLATLDEGQSASIANISYTFAKGSLPVFWTYDDDGTMVNLSAIKADAEKVAAGDEALIAKYTAWLNADHRFYARWFDKGISEESAAEEEDSTVYSVRLIGINHDDLADGSGKAGLTFQFVNLLNSSYQMSTTSTCSGGWRVSAVASAMSSDSGAIWEQVPELLKGALCMVGKTSHNTSGMSYNGLGVTDHRLFILSAAEMTGTTGTNSYATNFPWIRQEGTQYAWWKGRATGNTTNSSMIRGKQASPSTAQAWWTRTPYPSNTAYCVAIGANGHSFAPLAWNAQAGVAPAFCL